MPRFAIRLGSRGALFVFARLVPQLLSRFSQHGEAHCPRELLDAKQMVLARAHVTHVEVMQP
jgi:hypothetical protein